MRRDWQRGMTLIELLVALAVTSIILVGLGGVLVNASSRYQGWVDRLDSASTGTGLAASLQSDLHRYVVCGSFGSNLGQQLDLCAASDLNDPVVRYHVSTGAPYVITRQSPLSAPPAFMARSRSSALPYFSADCFDSGSTISGHVHVYNLRLQDGDGATNDPYNYSVYYVAPRPSGGCS